MIHLADVCVCVCVCVSGRAITLKLLQPSAFCLVVGIFIARQYSNADACYWYCNSVYPSVCLSVRPSVCHVPVFNVLVEGGTPSEFCKVFTTWKTGMLGYTLKKEWWYVTPFRYNTKTCQTDVQTDRPTELLYQYSTSAFLCWREIKTGCLCKKNHCSTFHSTDKRSLCLCA